MELSTYQQVAHKIRRLYEMLYPDAKSKVPNDGELDSWVAELYEKHPKFAGVRFWRVLVTALVSMFDSRLEGEKPESIDDLYEDIMNTLRED